MMNMPNRNHTEPTIEMQRMFSRNSNTEGFLCYDSWSSIRVIMAFNDIFTAIPSYLV
jgi:hypothetical protein